MQSLSRLKILNERTFHRAMEAQYSRADCVTKKVVFKINKKKLITFYVDCYDGAKKSEICYMYRALMN